MWTMRWLWSKMCVLSAAKGSCISRWRKWLHRFVVGCSSSISTVASEKVLDKSTVRMRSSDSDDDDFTRGMEDESLLNSRGWGVMTVNTCWSVWFLMDRWSALTFRSNDCNDSRSYRNGNSTSTTSSPCTISLCRFMVVINATKLWVGGFGEWWA
jgi:hypothetical protein